MITKTEEAVAKGRALAVARQEFELVLDDLVAKMKHELVTYQQQRDVDLRHLHDAIDVRDGVLAAKILETTEPLRRAFWGRVKFLVTGR